VHQQAYRVLMIAFVLFVITAALPLNLFSQVLGYQFSSAILNVGVLPWLGLAQGRLGVTYQQREQLHVCISAGKLRCFAEVSGVDLDIAEDVPEEENEVTQDALAKDGNFRFLAQMVFYAMVCLLAVWQLALLAKRFSQELVLLDEPEAALSPQRQQACPRATQYSSSGEGFTRNVLNAPERFLTVLFEAESQP
jgi:hypothetical protein